MKITEQLKELERAPVHRFEYLDSLRGLAALAVVLSHVIDNYGYSNLLSVINYTPFRVIWDGKAAVTLFFVLSGFVLSFKFFRNGNMQGFYYPSYAIARVFRIMPLFIFVLFSSIILRNYLFFDYNTIPSPTSHFHLFWQGKITLIEALKESILLIRIPNESYLRLIPQDWSLTGEMKQSLILPILIFICIRNQWILMLLTLLVIGLSPDNPIFYFYLGIVAAKNYNNIIDKWKTTSATAKYAILILGILLYSSSKIGGVFSDFKIQGVGSFLIICVSLCSNKFQKLLNSKFLLHIGRLSYGIYLIHFSILLTFIPWFIHNINVIGVTNHELVIIVSFLTLSAISMFVASITYRIIELPGIKIGKYIGASLKFNSTKIYKKITNN